MSLSQTVTYNTPADFTYDNTLIEMLTSAKLKQFTYPNETFMAPYFANDDGHRGGGVLTGTPTGTVVVANNVLDLTNAGVDYVEYASLGNADFTSQGAIKLGYIPSASGTPAADQYFFAITSGAGFNNLIECYHKTSNGKIFLAIHDTAGGTIVSWESTLVFNPTLGQEYEIEVNVDTAGTSRVFVNGVLYLEKAGTGTRIDPGKLLVGTNRSAVVASDMKISYIQVFSVVKHTAAYTSNGEPYDYSVDNPVILVNSTVLADGLLSLDEVVTKTGSDEVQYTVHLGGIDYYWTGAAWAISDGTYAQTNTAAIINANAATLDLSAGGNLQGKAYLHSDNGYTTPELVSNTYTYSFFVSATAPNECIVYGWVRDAKGTGVANVTVKAQAVKAFFHGTDLISDLGSTTTNSLGYWEMSLVETETVGELLSIIVDGRAVYKITIPDAVSSALSVLV